LKITIARTDLARAHRYYSLLPMKRNDKEAKQCRAGKVKQLIEHKSETKRFRNKEERVEGCLKEDP